jgi:hypothetical protein
MDGNFPIQQFLDGSDAKHLIIQVPNVFSGLPRLVSVQVTNRNGSSNQLQIPITPAAPVQGGQVVVFSQTAPLGQINVGSTYTLQWLVDSQTVLPAVYTFRVIFTNVQGTSPDAWLTSTVLRQTGQQQISRGNPLMVTASITVPAAAVQATVALQAASVDGLFQHTSDTLTLVVGQTAVVSDPRVLLTIGDIPSNNVARKVTINGVDGIEIPFRQQGQIPITVAVTNDATAAGAYNFSATVDTPAGLWSNPTVAPTTAGLQALSSRTVSVAISNTDINNSTTVKTLRVSAAHIPQGQNNPDFTSFISFPIQGYVGP